MGHFSFLFSGWFLEQWFFFCAPEAVVLFFLFPLAWFGLVWLGGLGPCFFLHLEWGEWTGRVEWEWEWELGGGGIEAWTKSV